MKMKNIAIEGAHIVFRNFSGEEKKYNRKGDRNFGLVIEDPEYVRQLASDGWNIKSWAPRTEEYPDGDPNKAFFYIPVAVAYDNFPPQIYMITGGRKKLLNAETVGAMDGAFITNVDISVRPYVWEVNGKSGVKAYVKQMYVEIAASEFDSKYSEYDED